MNQKTEWNNRLLTLPDTAFFNLMRNYLGTLETPFNKHRMIESLNNYLAKEETLSLMARELDDFDKKVLSVIFLLDGAPAAPIIDVLQDVCSSWEIRQRLINLQERLFLFKGERNIFFPTPQTEQFLREKFISPEKLIPSFPKEDNQEKASPWLDDDFLGAFLSYIIHSSPTLKADGTPNRKSISEIKKLFSCFKMNEKLAVLFLNSLKNRRLIKENSSQKLIIEISEWQPLIKADQKTRLIKLWAGYLICPEELTFPWKIRDGEKIITGLLSSLPGDHIYPKESLLRILSLLLVENRPPLTDLIIILQRLSSLGILFQTDKGLGLCPNLPLEENSENKSDKPLALHPNHELMLMPGAQFKDLFPLAWYARISNFEKIGTYILDQASYIKGLNKGEELPSFEKTLENLSLGSLPQNIQFSINNWKEQFRSVRLIEGLILKVDTNKIPLIEKNPLFEPYIREILGPGLYLINPQDQGQWENFLLNTGITAIPPVEKDTGPTVLTPPMVLKIEQGLFLNLKQSIKPEEEIRVNEEYSSNQEALLAILKDLTIQESEKDEIEERIRKKIILHPFQLKNDIVQKDIREAKGLDYNGKIRLIETAISLGQEYLEISWFTLDDDLQTDYIIPRHLSKEDENLILSGPYLSDPGGTPFRIRVRKISHCKRKKLSFFGF